MKTGKTALPWFDRLPTALRFVFALPVLDSVIYGFYRIVKGHPVAGLLWFVLGILPGSIIDMVGVALKGKITFCA